MYPKEAYGALYELWKIWCIPVGILEICNLDTTQCHIKASLKQIKL
jgi:hypothetical protein